MAKLKIKLKDLFYGGCSVLSPYQDIQIMDSQTGEFYTDVTYIAGGSMDNMSAIDSHLDDEVHGVTAKIAEDGKPYLMISIVSK